MAEEKLNFTEKQRIIKEETRDIIKYSLFSLLSVFILGLVAYFVKTNYYITNSALEKIFGISNIVVVLELIVVLAIRKTIYYSPRFVNQQMSLQQVLQTWRKIDMVLLAISETIAVVGLVVTILGLPFERTFHFFVAAAILMILILPVNLKIRGKLTTLEKYDIRF